MPPVNPEDRQYLKWGVSPPSREAHGTQEDIAAQLKDSHTHVWKQKGATLFCEAGPFEHGTEARFVDYLLQGTDENGNPILAKVK